MPTMMSRMSHLILALTLGLLFLFWLLLPVGFPVRVIEAANITVINTNDSGPGSLRQAIANAANGDTIEFDAGLVGQTIVLTSGQLVLTKNLTISGPGEKLLAISGNNASRVFYITATVTISGVTIRDGIATVGGGIWSYGGTVNLTNSTVSSNTATARGGGIFNRDNLTLTNSTVAGNTADDNGGGIYNFFDGIVTLTNSTVSSNTASFSGGGIFNLNGIVNLTNSTVSLNTASFSDGGGINDSDGTVNLTNSTVSSNTAAILGGGIFNDGSLTLTNSTVSGNSADEGGGINNNAGTVNLINSTTSGNTATNNGGGIYNTYSLNLINSTVVSNTADSDNVGGEAGGGLHVQSGTVTLTNTILANNQAGVGDDDCSDLNNTLNSAGYNLVQVPGGCVFTATGDITGMDPLVGPLQDNGGATLTHALLDGSPAIDAIPKGVNDCGTTITIDQRGLMRPADGDDDGTATCDIGAYERQSSASIQVVKLAAVTQTMVGETITYTYWVTNTGGIALNPVNANDDKLGDIPLVLTMLTPGQGTTGILTYTVVTPDLPGPLINTIIVSGTTQPTGTIVTDTDTVTVTINPYPSPTPTPTPDPNLTYLPIILKNQ